MSGVSVLFVCVRLVPATGVIALSLCVCGLRAIEPGTPAFSTVFQYRRKKEVSWVCRDQPKLSTGQWNEVVTSDLMSSTALGWER